MVGSLFLLLNTPVTHRIHTNSVHSLTFVWEHTTHTTHNALHTTLQKTSHDNNTTLITEHTTDDKQAKISTRQRMISHDVISHNSSPVTKAPHT